MATNCTPRTKSRLMRETAFVPPPPIPTTFTLAIGMEDFSLGTFALILVLSYRVKGLRQEVLKKLLYGPRFELKIPESPGVFPFRFFRAGEDEPQHRRELRIFQIPGKFSTSRREPVQGRTDL